MNFYQTALSLAISVGNVKRQADTLFHLAYLKSQIGDYVAAQKDASQSQRMAKISASLYIEAKALRIQSICCVAFGRYNQSISTSQTARDLLVLCGMSGGELDRAVVNGLSNTYRLKSEYTEARKIQSQILEQVPMNQDAFGHGFALLNISEIDVRIATPTSDVQRNIDTARAIFSSMKFPMFLTMCDVLVADLHLREAGNLLAAKEILQKSLKSAWGTNIETMTTCLERLANGNQWGNTNWPSTWPVVFLVHNMKSKQKPEIHRAFQYLGDQFLASGDRDTATSLFTAALEAFTEMDIHCSRAECMVRLGDISKLLGDMQRAAQLWKTARPLFEKSLQTKEVASIEERLAELTLV
jgi:tetratricopeptide (TPR) repeat protein